MLVCGIQLRTRSQELTAPPTGAAYRRRVPEAKRYPPSMHRVRTGGEKVVNQRFTMRVHRSVFSEALPGLHGIGDSMALTHSDKVITRSVSA